MKHDPNLQSPAKPLIQQAFRRSLLGLSPLVHLGNPFIESYEKGAISTDKKLSENFKAPIKKNKAVEQIKEQLSYTHLRLVDIRRLERKLKINERFLNFLTNKEQEYRDLILAHSHQRPSAVHNTREALDEAVLHLGKNSKKFFARYAFMQEQKRRNTNPLSEWDVKHDRFNQTLLRIQDRISRMDNPNELRREILSHRLRLGGHYKKIQQIENRPWINDRANTEERLSRTPDREERDAEKYHNERKISTLKAKVGQSESSSRVKFTSGDPVWKTVLRYRNP